MFSPQATDLAEFRGVRRGGEVALPVRPRLDVDRAARRSRLAVRPHLAGRQLRPAVDAVMDGIDRRTDLIDLRRGCEEGESNATSHAEHHVLPATRTTKHSQRRQQSRRNRTA